MQGRRWIDAGIRPFSVVVNMTARQLRSGRLGEPGARRTESERPAAGVAAHRDPRDRGAPARRADRAALAEITASGARLSVDDFGTGYASLPMLQRLRASAVCIDRSLIAGVPHDPERAGLARALIALARGLNFDVVAKGVETNAQREFLADAGCRICQGDLFAPAGAADEIEPFLRARRAA